MEQKDIVEKVNKIIGSYQEKDKSREMRLVIACPCGEVTDISSSPGGLLIDAWWVCEKCGLHFPMGTHLKSQVQNSEGLRLYPI